MKTRFIIMFSAIMGFVSGCYVNPAIETPDTTTTEAEKTSVVELGSSADELIQPWPKDKLPGNLSELQRRTYAEFEKSMDNGVMRMIPPPGHYLPPQRDRYLIGGATLDFTAAYPVGHPYHGRWKVTNVQLLGLMKDPNGMVYDAKNSMWVRLSAGSFTPEDRPVARPTNVSPIFRTVADHPPKRPLDAFESAALAKMQQGENIRAQVDGDRLRMLGSIRALGKNCTSCHQVEKTKLMGALTYELQREQ